jgi:integrase
MRHACVSLLGAQGVPLKVIAEILGHSDIRLTQNVYQHVYQEARHDAATKMDELLTRVAAKNPVATTVATKPTPSAIN